MSLWKIIFKNSIRIKTYRFRKNRLLFIFILYIIVLFWAIYLGPNIFNIILSAVVENIGNEYKYLIAIFIEYFLTLIFLVVLIYPLYNLYRKPEIGQTEIILASPVSHGDIFLGGFIGKLFFYFPGLLGIGPIITSALMQISDLNVLHFIIIYLSLFILMAFSLLIGTIIANLVEFQMAKSKKMRELGKSILFISAIIIISVFYLLRFLFDYLLLNPEFKLWLIFYPSYWYSNIILYVIDPALVTSHFLFILANFSLGIAIPPLICFLSYKYAHHFYALESSEINLSATIGKEHNFYRSVRKLTISQWKGLVITQLKQEMRKRENFFKIIIITSLILVFGVIISISLNELTLSEVNIWKLNLLKLMILSWMSGILFGIMMGINIFIDSKHLLFRYKSSPRGVKALIYSYLYENLYLIIFIDIILTIIFSFLFKLDILLFFVFFIAFIINCIIIFLQAVGIQCYKPLFGERGKNAYLISYFILFMQLISLIITLYVIIPNVPSSIETSDGFLFILIFHMILTLGISFVIFFFGIRKLKKIE